jgi:hypothetical protein
MLNRDNGVPKTETMRVQSGDDLGFLTLTWRTMRQKVAHKAPPSSPYNERTEDNGKPQTLGGTPREEPGIGPP